MEIPIYYFGCEIDGQKYVVCLDGSHAAIRPIEEVVVDAKRTLITYTHLGAAKKALSSRAIYSYYASGGNYGWNSPALATKKDMKLKTAKLTLDK